MIRNSPYHDLEHGPVKWVQTFREQKIVLNGLMVLEKALEFATATELVESFIHFVYHIYLMKNIH